MPTSQDLYHKDFYSWAMTTTQCLRQQQWQKIDWEAVIEELEGLARRDKWELASRLEVLLIHLLKWCAQSQGRQPGHSWRDTIQEQRSQIELVLEDSPSLQHEVGVLLCKRYRKAGERALNQTGLSDAELPRTCPWSGAQMLADDFWPETC